MEQDKSAVFAESTLDKTFDLEATFVTKTNKTTSVDNLIDECLRLDELVRNENQQISSSFEKQTESNLDCTQTIEKVLEANCDNQTVKCEEIKNCSFSKITSNETEEICSPEAEFDENQLDKIYEMVKEKQFSKLSNPQPFSPSHLLAAAFQKLKINVTADETFLSCHDQSQASLIADDNLNNTQNKIESGDSFEYFENADASLKAETGLNISKEENNSDNATKQPEENIQKQCDFTSVNCEKLIVEEEFNQKDDNINNVEEEQTNTNSLSSSFQDDEQENTEKLSRPTKVADETEINNEKPNPSFLIASYENSDNKENFETKDSIKSRKSTGVLISSMKMELTPPPLRLLHNNVCEELFNASNSQINEKSSDYKKYFAYKLDINRYQQTIAKLKMEIKEKEAQVIKLFPHKIRYESEESNEIVDLNDSDKIQKLKDQCANFESELKEKINEQKRLFEKNLQLQNEVEDLKKENIQLKKCLDDTDDIISKYSFDLAETKTFLENEKTKYNELSIKYERVKQILFCMKSNELIYKKQLEANGK